MAKTSYDPGKATPCRVVNAHEELYALDSFRDEGKSYLVNLKAGTCTCPDWAKRHAEARTDCKHLTSVRVQARFLKRLAIARQLSDADLSAWLVRYTERGDAEAAGVLRVVREERRQAAARAAHIASIIDRDAELKAVFA